MKIRIPPSQYKERVLVSVLGMSPAILTETLWALKHQTEPFIPTRIIILTTSKGSNRIHTHLFGDDKKEGAFFTYCKDFNFDTTLLTQNCVKVIRDNKGAELTDIITDQDNKCVADKITQVIKDLSDDPDTAIHMSLAGGRKTMGYYAGYALSLFGREQDRLSHVLVEENYELCSDFYYPTPYDSIVVNRNDSKDKHNAKYAQVSLTEIPFVRIRANIPPALLKGDIAFNNAVDMANWDNTNVIVSFNIGVHSLFVNGLEIPCEDVLHLAMLKMVLDFQFSPEHNIPALEKGDKPCRHIGREFCERIYFFTQSTFQDAQDVDNLDDDELLGLLYESAVHGSTLVALVEDKKHITKIKGELPDVDQDARIAITHTNWNSRLTRTNKFLLGSLGNRLGSMLNINKQGEKVSGTGSLQVDISEGQYV